MKELVTRMSPKTGYSVTGPLTKKQFRERLTHEINPVSGKVYTVSEANYCYAGYRVACRHEAKELLLQYLKDGFHVESLIMDARGDLRSVRIVRRRYLVRV